MHGYAAAEGSGKKGRSTYTKAAEFTDLIFGPVTDAPKKESAGVKSSFAAPITTAAMNVNTTAAARRTWSRSRSGGADAWAGGEEEEGMGGAWVGGEATGLGWDSISKYQPAVWNLFFSIDDAIIYMQHRYVNDKMPADINEPPIAQLVSHKSLILKKVTLMVSHALPIWHFHTYRLRDKSIEI